MTATPVAGPDVAPVEAAVRRKHGVQVALVGALYAVRNLLSRMPSAERVAVVVTLPLGTDG